jgi:hypothetical protein
MSSHRLKGAEAPLTFGGKLAAKDQNYTVSAAWLLKEFLSKKGYKLADDPW